MKKNLCWKTLIIIKKTGGFIKIELWWIKGETIMKIYDSPSAIP